MSVDHKTTGIHSIFNSAFFYELFQNITGGKARRAKFVETHISPRPGMTVLDIGCGTAAIVNTMPDVEYTGLDISSSYVQMATRLRGDKGAFHVGNATEMLDIASGRYDRILLLGVSHHLSDDEMDDLFGFASHHLVDGGKLVTADPCYCDNQSSLSRFLIRMDRGRNVRTAEGYGAIARRSFSHVDVFVKSDMTRIPMTFCVMECRVG